MRRRLLIGLILSNALLGLAVLASSSRSQVHPTANRDCCEGDGAGLMYCCHGCCWFFQDCRTDSDCSVTESSGG